MGKILFHEDAICLKSVSIFFQFYMDLHFEEINSTTNIITNDIMIHSESDQQHDKHLLQVSINVGYQS